MEDDLNDQIRAAVGAGEYQKALVLWDDYAARMQTELRAGGFSRGRLAQAWELVEWSRRVVLCARSHAQRQLKSLHVAAEYGEPSPPQASRLIQARF